MVSVHVTMSLRHCRGYVRAAGRDGVRRGIPCGSRFGGFSHGLKWKLGATEMFDILFWFLPRIIFLDGFYFWNAYAVEPVAVQWEKL